MVTPRGAAARSGLRLLDVVESIAGRSVREVGNGIVRNYLTLLLSSQKSVPITVQREGAAVPLSFALESNKP